MFINKKSLNNQTYLRALAIRKRRTKETNFPMLIEEKNHQKLQDKFKKKKKKRKMIAKISNTKRGHLENINKINNHESNSSRKKGEHPNQ